MGAHVLRISSCNGIGKSRKAITADCFITLSTGTKFPRGMPSFCCANSLVIEALLENSPVGAVLIEGTANQINQFGGYTGMTPSDFHDYVCAIVDRTGFSRERLILGGDHIGPLV